MSINVLEKKNVKKQCDKKIFDHSKILQSERTDLS